LIADHGVKKVSRNSRKSDQRTSPPKTTARAPVTTAAI
jgi:hypothetical protein